ncbi:MAG: NAD(P)H-hydrate dehydratase, partial [Candidatus Dadabacteria bacterium]
NNGGDGYVAARWLQHFGQPVQVLALAPTESLAGDAAWAAQVWGAVGGRTELIPSDEPSRLAGLPTGAVLVDAVFGTGFHGTMREPAASIFEALSRRIPDAGHPVVAVDIPSGVDAASGAATGEVVSADVTVTMGLHKVGLWSWPGAGVTGTIECVDLGYPQSVVATEAPVAFGLTLDDLGLLRRPATGHKGTFGDVLVCAGSADMPGAAQLCARAALRAGAGRVLVCSVAAVLDALPPEMIRVPVGAGWEAPSKALIDRIAAADAVVVGPGWGRFAEDRNWLAAILAARNGAPTVIDADGLRVLAEIDARALGEHVVLTPHPGEAAALLTCSVADVQANRLDAADRLVQRWGATIVLKGAGTIIASPGQLPRILRFADPALAVPGSGDVLAGIIASCAAHSQMAFASAIEGVLWHASVARLLPPSGNLAGMIADLLPVARPALVV